MRCKHCGHNPDRHDENGCHQRIATGWSESRQQFAGQRNCECTAYEGPPPVAVSDCPHEFVRPAPDLCVHCGQRVSQTAK